MQELASMKLSKYNQFVIFDPIFYSIGEFKRAQDKNFEKFKSPISQLNLNIFLQK